MIQPIPENYPRVNSFLMVPDLEKEADFIKAVFDAKETERITLPNGSVIHLELRIGDSVIMLGENGGMENMSSMLYIYVEDTAATYHKALEAGAKSIMPPGEQFYGDINAGVQDSFGHFWWIASQFEVLTPEQLNTNAAKARGMA